jgi:hypothetical protein
MAASLPRRDVTLAAFQEALLAVVQMEPRGQRLGAQTGRPPPKGSKTWSYALADGRVHDDAARRRPSEIDGSADLLRPLLVGNGGRKLDRLLQCCRCNVLLMDLRASPDPALRSPDDRRRRKDRMATYQYRCGLDGVFDVIRPMGTAGSRLPCPVCGSPAARAFSPPMLLLGARALLSAIERAEKTREEPEVVSAVPPRKRSPADASNPAVQSLPRP